MRGQRPWQLASEKPKPAAARTATPVTERPSAETLAFPSDWPCGSAAPSSVSRRLRLVRLQRKFRGNAWNRLGPPGLGCRSLVRIFCVAAAVILPCAHGLWRSTVDCYTLNWNWNLQTPSHLAPSAVHLCQPDESARLGSLSPPCIGSLCHARPLGAAPSGLNTASPRRWWITHTSWGLGTRGLLLHSGSCTPFYGARSILFLLLFLNFPPAVSSIRQALVPARSLLILFTSHLILLMSF